MTIGQIVYVIPLLEQEESIFQGFSYGIIKAHSIIRKILYMPQNLVEFYSEKNKIINLRMQGGSSYSILPINRSLLEQIDPFLESPFLCIFSDNETYQDVENYRAKTQNYFLHVSIKESHSSVKLHELTREHIFKYVQEAMKRLEGKFSPEELSFIKNIMSKGRKNWAKDNIAVRTKKHLVTLPNELTLNTMNYDFSGSEQLVSPTDKPYIEAITESFDIVEKERPKFHVPIFPFPPNINLILTVPSMYMHMYRKNLFFKKVSDSAQIVSSIHKSFAQQKGFSFPVEVDKIEKIVSSKIGQFIIKMRRDEIEVYTSAVAVKACDNFTPVLRLPPSINTLHGKLKQLGDCVRSRNIFTNKIRKVARLYENITTDLTAFVDPEYIKRIDKDFNHIKLICDAPLEWLPIRDLPLMLRFDVSRVPTTPGNLFLQMAIQGNAMILSTEKFKEILLIRSYSDKDPIRNILIKAIEVIKPKIRIRTVDVFSEEDFIKALNDFDGAVMIFDGHGSHEKDIGIGSLVIGGKHVDIMNLRGKVKMPPIVLLSACDTHPIDASHASVANAFLASGAVTVLASTLPINAIETSIFLARLIGRIEDFLPLAPMRWTRVISGMQRMTYVTELINSLIQFCGLTILSAVKQEIQLKANNLINPWHADWYEQVLEALSDKSGWSVVKLKEHIKDRIPVPQCINYIQLGNPELIICVKDDLLNQVAKELGGR